MNKEDMQTVFRSDQQFACLFCIQNHFEDDKNS